MTRSMRQALVAHKNTDCALSTHTDAVALHAEAGVEVWQGDCLDAAHVNTAIGARMVDALVFDAPYSSKTHDGHAAGKVTAGRAASFARKQLDQGVSSNEIRYASKHGASDMRNDIEYPAFDEAKIVAFCSTWLPRCSGWVVSMTDDQLAPLWMKAFQDAGLYVFSPLALIETGSRIRMTGDGPANWACWIVVARPRSREFASWGALPGAYVQAAERDINSQGGSDRIVGGKPLRSMCGIVRDYSRRGALVCDPFLGGGTTGLACKQLGRRFIGMEQSPERAALSVKRIARTHEQGDLFEKAEATDAR